MQWTIALNPSRFLSVLVSMSSNASTHALFASRILETSRSLPKTLDLIKIELIDLWGISPPYAVQQLKRYPTSPKKSNFTRSNVLAINDVKG